MEKKDMRAVWMIVSKKNPVLEHAHQWEFEKEEKVIRQKLYLTFENQKAAQRWLDKWHSRPKSYRIVRAELHYSIPD